MAVNISELIAKPERLADRAVLHELRQLIETYPYYQTVRLLYLKGLFLLHDISFGEELRRTALYVADRKVLFNLVEGDYYTLNPVVRKAPVSETGNKEEKKDRTLVLIDAFLNGVPLEKDEPAPVLEDDGGLSADYTTYILREEEVDQTGKTGNGIHPMKGMHLIDDFIKNSDENRTENDGESANLAEGEESLILPSVDEEDGYFTETLAKIYIKQQRYTKALEIIRRLSLKYPKKNAYFADQIRFLEKLIINSTNK